MYQVMWDELSPVEWEQKLLTALKIQEQEDDMIKERHEMDEVARATEVVDGKRKKSISDTIRKNWYHNNLTSADFFLLIYSLEKRLPDPRRWR